MTTPSRINDILHEMEQDPDLAQALRDRVLGQEISVLPAAVAQNQGLIIRLMERQVELASAVNTALDAVVSAMSQAGENTARALEEQGRRIEGVESALAELREEGQRTRESLGQVLTDVKQLQADTTETKADVKQLQVEMTETRSDVRQLQADMAEARGDIKHLQTTSDELRSDVRNIQGDVRRIDGRLDRGFGTNYEAKVSQNVRSILGQQAGVRNARVLKGPNLRNDREFDRQVEGAETSGAITEDESDELLLLDLIVSGTRTGTTERVYAGIEVSITANDDDVDRAADRVEILRRVTGETVMAVVIAARVDEPQRELAAGREVVVVVHPE